MKAIKSIFTGVSNAVQSLLDATSKPLVRFIDFDLGQLNDPTPPVSYPCLLIDFTDTSDFFNYTDKSQRGTQTVQLTIAFKRFERTNNLVNPLVRDQALAMLDAVEAIHQIVQNTEGPCFGRLTRTGVSQAQRADLRVFTLTYTCSVETEAPTTGAGVYVPISSVADWVAHGSVPVAADIDAEFKAIR
jgi:hypothetical protein